ncbi:MAG: hypothetical protein DWC06_04595 [Candidatus Poseidoniales archaeon]|nr:hypothetical protein [Candidatus Poseidoniales archaeon]RJV00949.1 MAG: hypothetical protein DWC06_04595 [Candidatus Poseidoniales archaeon]|tara:strand:+ start:7023 stop:7943 length:921 start_codon:yes stop_codon:yes gene_type:complete
MASNDKPMTRKQRRIERKRAKAMAGNHGRIPATLSDALVGDDSLPLDATAKEYWVKDLQNPLRIIILPTLRILLTMTLHITYYVKRLLPIQWKAHRFLQWQICFFMKYFVRPEANVLILRHFQAESNLLNFVIDNSGKKDVEPVLIYPKMIRDLMVQTFVHHDQGVLMTMRDLEQPDRSNWPIEKGDLAWTNWNPIRVDYSVNRKKWTQFLDFETAHELFKTSFCFWLTSKEYEAAINSFQFDHSVGLLIDDIVGAANFADIAYNRFPMIIVGPTGLSYRFLMHGFFVEHVHAHLEKMRAEIGLEN